jgi:hypothetical protein
MEEGIHYSNHCLIGSKTNNTDMVVQQHNIGTVRIMFCDEERSYTDSLVP